MITIDELRKHFPTEVGELEMRYEELMIKKRTPKTVYKFEVLGKVYDEDVFTRNYTSFFYDIRKILSYKQISACVGEGIVATYERAFRNSYPIGTSFYLNTNNCTERKIKMIDKICEEFGIIKKVIEHVDAGEVIV